MGPYSYNWFLRSHFAEFFLFFSGWNGCHDFAIWTPEKRRLEDDPFLLGRSIFRGNSLLNFLGVILQLYFYSLFLSCGWGVGIVKGREGKVGPGMIGSMVKSWRYSPWKLTYPGSRWRLTVGRWQFLWTWVNFSQGTFVNFPGGRG